MSELPNLIRGVLRIDPAAHAIEYDRQWLTWGDLDRTVTAIEAALRAAGLPRGARVAGLLRNHPMMAATLLAVTTSDRCIVTLNPSLPDDRLAADIRTLKPPAIIGLAQDWSRSALVGAARAVGCLGLVVEQAGDVRAVAGLEAVGDHNERRDAPGIAIEMLTSGTTGAPKRIPLRASSFERAIIAAGVYDRRKPGDPPRLRGGVQILNAPFAHISGVFGLFNCVAAGRACCLLDRFNVTQFADAVRRHRPKVAGATPAALRMILDAQVPVADLASLVAFRTGTAPLNPDLADEFHQRYGIPVLQNYGATEFAGGLAGWTLDDFRAHHQDKRGAVGRLNPGVQARVVDQESGEPLPFGQEGLVEFMAAQLGDGASWVRTMDLGVLDRDGFLWINRRYDNAIVRGGFKVMPDDVVRALEAHAAIREAAVVGLPDPRLGQVPVGAYILRSGVPAPSEAELRDFLRATLLPYQVPVRLIALDELPRTPSLKVSQPELRTLLEAAFT